MSEEIRTDVTMMMSQGHSTLESAGDFCVAFMRKDGEGSCMDVAMLGNSKPSEIINCLASGCAHVLEEITKQDRSEIPREIRMQYACESFRTSFDSKAAKLIEVEKDSRNCVDDLIRNAAKTFADMLAEAMDK